MKTLVILVALACAITACYSTREAAVTPKPVESTSGASMTGEWLLTRLNDRDIAVQPPPHMKINAAGQVSGRGGVNTYTAQLDPALAAKGDFKLSSLISTEMAGSPEARKLEREFFGTLQSAARFKVDRDQLTLLDSAAKPLAVFARKPAP